MAEFPFAAAAGLQAAGAAADLYVQKRNQERGEAMQRDFANNGIAWRVADARRAGIHPLYALGASTSSPSPIAVGSNFQDMGQNLSRALQPSMTDTERQAEQLKLDLLKAQIKETDARADALASESARNRQTSLVTAPFPEGAGQVSIQPDPKVSQALDDPTRTAGWDHPFFKRYEFSRFFPGIDIPYSQEGPAEGMEGMGALAATLFRNFIERPLAALDDSETAKWWKAYWKRKGVMK